MKIKHLLMRQGGGRNQKSRSRGLTGKNSITVRYLTEHVGEEELPRHGEGLGPTSSPRLLAHGDKWPGRVLGQQSDLWHQGQADGQKLWPQREGRLYKNHSRRQAGLGRTPWSSLLLPSDPMLLMPICQNQLKQRARRVTTSPLLASPTSWAQSRIGKGGNWSGEGGKQE